MPAGKKPGKVVMVWPATGRTMEASTAAYADTYEPMGWTLAEPEPAPKAKAKAKADPEG